MQSALDIRSVSGKMGHLIPLSGPPNMSAQEQPYLLQIEKLNKSFRGLQAVNDYDLALTQGELLGIIGPNGAGKTTLFNLITGVIKPTSGHIYLKGAEITHHRPEAVARLGIARTFQKLRLFKPLPAIENVKVALQTSETVRLWDVLFSLPHFNRRERAVAGRARELLALLELDGLEETPAERLSFGQQRYLEIACALALSPRLLLLDEPAGGLNPSETEHMMRLIAQLHQQLNLAIILIEHNMQVIMSICQRIQALNYGRVIAEGNPAAIRNNSHVIEAYLGHAAGG